MIVNTSARYSLAVDNPISPLANRLPAVRSVQKVALSIIFRNGRVPDPCALCKGAVLDFLHLGQDPTVSQPREWMGHPPQRSPEAHLSEGTSNRLGGEFVN